MLLGLPQTGTLQITKIYMFFPKEESQNHCVIHPIFLKNVVSGFKEHNIMKNLFPTLFLFFLFLKVKVSLWEILRIFIVEAISINKLKHCFVSNFLLH